MVVLRLRATTDPSRSGEGADLGCSGLGRCSVIGVFFLVRVCFLFFFWLPEEEEEGGGKEKRGGERRGN